MALTAPPLRRLGLSGLLLALGALACAPPTAVSPATPGVSSLPATFAMSFVFEPTLTLRLLRNGQPYRGDAVLTVPGNDRQSEEQSPLSFQDGQAALSPDIQTRFIYKEDLGLRVEGRDVPIPHAGNSNPFACAQSIDAVRTMDACATIPPDSDTPLDHCDQAGQRAWQKARQQLAARSQECWASIDDVSVQRLEKLADSGLIEFACRHLIESRGPTPSVRQSVRLIPTCTSYFSFGEGVLLEEEYTRQNLPRSFEAAMRGDSLQMRAFYRRYRTLAPEKAEQIRALAEQRFGPDNRARWLALRNFVESQTRQEWRASLCDLRDGQAEIAVQPSKIPRYTRSTSAIERALPAYPAGDPEPSQPDSRQQLIDRITAALKARGDARSVVVVETCRRGLHWYLAEVKS